MNTPQNLQEGTPREKAQCLLYEEIRETDSIIRDLTRKILNSEELIKNIQLEKESDVKRLKEVETRRIEKSNERKEYTSEQRIEEIENFSEAKKRLEEWKISFYKDYSVRLNRQREDMVDNIKGFRGPFFMHQFFSKSPKNQNPPSTDAEWIQRVLSLAENSLRQINQKMKELAKKRQIIYGEMQQRAQKFRDYEDNIQKMEANHLGSHPEQDEDLREEQRLIHKFEIEWTSRNWIYRRDLKSLADFMHQQYDRKWQYWNEMNKLKEIIDNTTEISPSSTTANTSDLQTLRFHRVSEQKPASQFQHQTIHEGHSPKGGAPQPSPFNLPVRKLQPQIIDPEDKKRLDQVIEQQKIRKEVKEQTKDMSLAELMSKFGIQINNTTDSDDPSQNSPGEKPMNTSERTSTPEQETTTKPRGKTLPRFEFLRTYPSQFELKKEPETPRNTGFEGGYPSSQLFLNRVENSFSSSSGTMGISNRHEEVPKEDWTAKSIFETFNYSATSVPSHKNYNVKVADLTDSKRADQMEEVAVNTGKIWKSQSTNRETRFMKEIPAYPFSDETQARPQNIKTGNETSSKFENLSKESNESESVDQNPKDNHYRRSQEIFEAETSRDNIQTSQIEDSDDKNEKIVQKPSKGHKELPKSTENSESIQGPSQSSNEEISYSPYRYELNESLERSQQSQETIQKDSPPLFSEVQKEKERVESALSSQKNLPDRVKELLKQAERKRDETRRQYEDEKVRREKIREEKRLQLEELERKDREKEEEAARELAELDKRIQDDERKSQKWSSTKESSEKDERREIEKEIRKTEERKQALLEKLKELEPFQNDESPEEKVEPSQAEIELIANSTDEVIREIQEKSSLELEKIRRRCEKERLARKRVRDEQQQRLEELRRQEQEIDEESARKLAEFQENLVREKIQEGQNKEEEAARKGRRAEKEL